MDVQAESSDVPDPVPTSVGEAESLSAEAISNVNEAVNLLTKAARPVIVAGGGVTLANAVSFLNWQSELVRLL